ncbi:MAG: indole-3-glycerol phosphate synthase TrpC [Desulfotomaculaceae bacterium]|nr:indole-3-glycerol phosphate synthase TrpC [Desulfotomaculaceae bacterium]
MILNTIAAAAKIRIERKKSQAPLEKVKKEALRMNPATGFPFEKSLNKQKISFICEIKKASPAKGLIAADFPYLQIAKEYELAGADAISVLTEPEYFLGSDDYLAQIKDSVSLPVLRKDFIVDAYQIYEAKILGASAVLLICALLDAKTVRDYLSICDELGLSALVEAHDEIEVEQALAAGARVIGVNNRNLKDFTVDLNNSIRLRKLVPESITFVAESGIQTASDIEMLRRAKVNGVLIGETLMRSADKKTMLAKLRGYPQ